MLLPLIMWGQAELASEPQRNELRVAFPVNVTRLDPALDGNGERLDSAVAMIARSLHADDARLVSVEFFGWASPEGSHALNQRLSRGRRDNIAAYVRRRVHLPDSLVTLLPAGGIDWQGLHARVLADTLTPDRDAILDILLNEPEQTLDARGRVAASRMGRLRAHRRAWTYMLRNHFPALRRAGVAIVVAPQEPEPLSTPTPPTPLPSLPPLAPSTLAPGAPAAAPAVSSAAPPAGPAVPTRFWSLHTNLLYDALLLPNLGAELYVGRNCSLMANWMYGWWDQRSRFRWWRAYGGELAARYWFGDLARRKPLSGHHIGLYGQIFIYDFEWGKTGYLGGVPGKSIFHNPSYTLGVEYGFALPIARRLNIDFNIGIGYFGGKYYKYRPYETHWVWRGTHQRRYFGPTKIEVSLVWLLGRTNINQKGGRR